MSLANRSPQFLNDVSGQSYHFSGAAVSWNCGVPENIDANFIATNSSGFKEDVVVVDNISSSYAPTAVSGVSIMPFVSLSVGGGGAYSLTTWSGYQFCNGYKSGGAYCANTPNQLQSVIGYFVQPNVYVPTGSNQPGCGTVYCDLAVWTGLDTYAPGGLYILQTGSIGYTRLCPLCVTSYNLVWEDLESSSSGAVYCTGSLGGGNTIIPEVLLSSFTNEYYVSTTDTTTGFSCTSNPYPYTWSHTPYWGDFILERAPFHGGQDLVKFQDFYFQDKIQYGGSWTPISNYYNDLWYDMVYMQNSGVYNLCSGIWTPPSSCTASVPAGSSGYGEFYNTWISSQYT